MAVILMLTLITPRRFRNEDSHSLNFRENAVAIHLTKHPVVITACMFCVVMSSLTQAAIGQTKQSHPCLSPATITVLQSLQTPKGEYVPGTFEDLVETIAAENKITIWCDRRLAKDTKLDVAQFAGNPSGNSESSTLEIVLKEASKIIRGSLAIVDGVVLIVPAEKQDQIEAEHWRLVLSKPGMQLNNIAVPRFSWPNASIASEVFRNFEGTYLSKVRSEIIQEPNIEYDLWKAFEFRTAPAKSIGTCLLSGFDLHLEPHRNDSLVVQNYSGGSNLVQWTYRADDLKRIGTEYTKAWKKRWPESELTRSGAGGDYVVTTSVAAHRDLVRPLMMLKRIEPKKPSRVEYTGDLSGELDIAIRSLSAKTKIEFFPLPLPPQLGSKQVNLSFKNNTLDECLKMIGDASGLTFRKMGRRIEIVLP
ncbi:MAG: hypothetical protein ABL921_24780 [Pirellula sp.]